MKIIIFLIIIAIIISLKIRQNAKESKGSLGTSNIDPYLLEKVKYSSRVGRLDCSFSNSDLIEVSLLHGNINKNEFVNSVKRFAKSHGFLFKNNSADELWLNISWHK